ncbi:MAG: carbohydrate binding domain-containing protein [Prevotella sp.]|nr:carbohydrate binding domain-containing protein [Prevotella sp.]
MKQIRTLTLVAAMALASLAANAQHQFTINAKKMGAPVQPTMYGIFFEDINFGADGGLYAEMVQNRSFEFPQRLMGWNTFGNVEVKDQNPAFERNPHYVALGDSGHLEKRTGLENRGFFGMGVKKGMKYDFSVYARENSGGPARIRVELVGSDNQIVSTQRINISGKQWKKYSATLSAKQTDAKALMRIFLETANGADLDHVSLFPQDNWHGLRADLVNDLKDLNPGIFRFPGGCIVEGTDLATRYQWKNSVGPAENRPLNENRWNYTFAHRMYPNYFQTYGLGFYEFFLLAEHIGAEPLPIVSCGLACQFQNRDEDAATVHVAVKDLEPYIQDALDLIEFANGPADSKWGKLRAEMGHPEPFNLKFIGVGNEQWGPLYPERLEPFLKAIRAKYPKIKVVGTSGPSPDDNDGKQFSYGWEQMRRLKADLVDEHYYRDQQWFMQNVTRYDNYSRKGPKVFAGEYACHTKGDHQATPTGMNTFEASLCEAAFMTGLERNADLVHMATYAPLFSHVEGWQWRPDLIWMDNLSTVRTPNYYVQQLYGQNAGTNVLSLTEGGKPVTGQDGLCASAVYDKDAGKYIVKIVNTGNADQTINLTFKGIKTLPAGTVTTLHADRLNDVNTIDKKNTVVPRTATVEANGNTLTVTVPAKTFAVYKF